MYWITHMHVHCPCWDWQFQLFCMGYWQPKQLYIITKQPLGYQKGMRTNTREVRVVRTLFRSISRFPISRSPRSFISLLCVVGWMVISKDISFLELVNITLYGSFCRCKQVKDFEMILNAITDPYKRKAEGDKAHTQRNRQCDHRGRGPEWCRRSPGRPASTWSWKRRAEDSALGPPKGAQPSDTLISHRPPGLWENKFLLF